MCGRGQVRNQEVAALVKTGADVRGPKPVVRGGLGGAIGAGVRVGGVGY